jgi:hypothetical protein
MDLLLSCLRTFRKLARRTSLWVLPPALLLISAGVLISQFAEIGGNTEVLSLTSFAVLMTLAGIAFGWSRVTWLPETVIRAIYHAASDLFLASLLALVSVFFAWIRSLDLPLVKAFPMFFFALHWIFLALSVALSFAALVGLVQVAGKTEDL